MPLQHISGHIQAMFYKFCGLFKTFMPPKKTGCRKHIQFLGYICLVSKKGVTDCYHQKLSLSFSMFFASCSNYSILNFFILPRPLIR